jgi:hypothetical protein
MVDSGHGKRMGAWQGAGVPEPLWLGKASQQLAYVCAHACGIVTTKRQRLGPSKAKNATVAKAWPRRRAGTAKELTVVVGKKG